MGKALRLKKQRRLHEASRRTLKERVLSSRPDDKIKIIDNRQGREKMSEVVGRFAAPWIETARNEEQYKLIIRLAIVAWNLALITEKEWTEEVDPKLLEELGEPGLELLGSMIAHKLAFYADYDRPILDFELSSAGGELRLDVVSASRNPEDHGAEADARDGL